MLPRAWFASSCRTSLVLSASARTMSQSNPKPFASDSQIKDFQNYLESSDRILALLGAGLSAASGLPTFRGAGGMWKNHQATSLATPQAFRQDPGLVWQFYSYRRHMALQAKPNPAHYALAELARKKPNFVTLSQNVDGLSQRANHPPTQLHLLHGNLFDIKCFGNLCDYFEPNNLTDPIVPALAITSVEPKPSETDKTGEQATSSLYNAMGMEPKSTIQGRINLLDPYIKDETIPRSELPHCPNCTTNLLRPGVVWFGEALPESTIHAISAWINETDKIDLMLVIGTTAEVYPAAGYIARARLKGARIAVINMDSENLGATGSLREGDWMFEGDAGVVVPEILKPVIGDLKVGEENKGA